MRTTCNILVTLASLVIILGCAATAMQVSCPSRCRSCENGVAECSKRSLTAPPRVYPAGTKTIDLDGNHLRVIAERTFDYLDSVEVLKMSGNKIVALRNDAFSPFPNLVILDLGDNRISRMSRRVFKDLSQLKTLSLNRNKIESLDGTLQYVPSLYQLNMANNRITSLGQFDLAPLGHAHYLDFRDNLISSIHSQAFKDLVNLRYLFLNSNPLVVTPRFEFGSQVLQLVDLSNCDMKRTPGPFPSTVTDLRLGHNKIMKVEPDDLTNITDLQLLTLNDNELHFLADGSLSHLAQLQEVWLRQNSLVYIPRGLPSSVRKVHMDSNNIQMIETGLFNNMSHLDYLTVENNQVGSIQPNTFAGLRFLTALNFQGNLIHTLEKDTFADLASLSTILLSSNPLRKIEKGAFKNLANLTQLFMGYIGDDDFELEDNFLVEMLKLQNLHLMNSPGLADDLMALINDSTRFPVPLERLTHLDLSYNNLKWVSPRVRQVFPNLSSMLLDGNPLMCSQSLKWLKDWMVSSQISFHNSSELVCETPAMLKNRPIKSIEDYEWASDVEAEVVGVSNVKDESPVLEVKGGALETKDAVQQDASEVRTKAATKMEKDQSLTLTPKEQAKGKGKGRKGKKPEKKSKSDKKGKDKNNKGPQKL
jgi:Leucine-rich repeat (LRR) protein